MGPPLHLDLIHDSQCSHVPLSHVDDSFFMIRGSNGT